LSSLTPQREGLLLAGLVVQVRALVTRRGRMAFVTLDDGSAQVEVAVYPELLEQKRATLEDDAVVVIEGRVSEDGYTGGLRVAADTVMDVVEARARFARRLCLACNGGANAQRLRRILEPYRKGTCPVSIAYENGRARGEIDLPEEWRVSLHEPLLAELREWLAPANVRIIYH
jgi:DNA polymerase-3 subunit alpha